MIQAAAYRILHCFSTSNEHSFASLCKQAGYPTDLGGYYIRQLVSGGYLEKGERGQYSITPKGKQAMASASDTHPHALRPRLNVLLVATIGEKYVTLKRGRQPFIGVTEWPAGAVRLGEGLPSAAQRILLQRLGVTAEPVLQGFFRRTDYFGGKDQVFDDKLFAVHAVNLDSDTDLSGSIPDEIITCTEDELHSLPHPAKSLIDIFAFTRKQTNDYEEREYILTSEDLSL